MTGIIFIDWLYQFLLTYELEFVLIIAVAMILIYVYIDERRK